jgi:hypothetical protein
VQVVEIARKAQLVKMGASAIDGSQVKASASKHEAMGTSACSPRQSGGRRRSRS